MADLEAFAKEWFSAKQSVEKLQGVVNPVAKKWAAQAEEDQVDYKSKARDFVKLYSFLSHLVPLRGAGLEKLFVFLDNNGTVPPQRGASNNGVRQTQARGYVVAHK